MVERSRSSRADDVGGTVTGRTRLDLSAVRTWIVSAWRPEQNWLIERISAAHPLIEQTQILSQCGPFAFVRTGIGSIRAAAVLSRFLAQAEEQRCQSDAVWFVATAGAYSLEHALKKAFFAKGVTWTDGDLLSGAAYLPKAATAVETIPADLPSALNSSLSVVSTPAITLSPNLASALSSQGNLENLELYGVAQAAREANVRWGAVLGVSNFVGPDAHKEWQKHHEQASVEAQRLLFETDLRSRM